MRRLKRTRLTEVIQSGTVKRKGLCCTGNKWKMKITLHRDRNVNGIAELGRIHKATHSNCQNCSCAWIYVLLVRTREIRKSMWMSNQNSKGNWWWHTGPYSRGLRAILYIPKQTWLNDCWMMFVYLPEQPTFSVWCETDFSLLFFIYKD